MSRFLPFDELPIRGAGRLTNEIALARVTKMNLRNTTLLFAVLVALPIFTAAQEQRPALVPLAQGGGGSVSSTSSMTGTSIGNLSDGPITPGEVVHINVFDSPDFSLITRVSASGDVPYPILGSFHIGGLNSMDAATMLAKELKDRNLMLDPEVTVTVDSAATGITVLGEVHSPGVYPPPGKHQLSDLLATAGGLTANTGRIIEITNAQDPTKREYISWDPTMHNTESFDRPVAPGDRVLVRACGIAYVGGNVVKPGAYSLCGSPKMTLSEVMALAGGVAPNAAPNKTFLVRAQPDGTKIVEQIDVKKVLTSRVADPIVHEDDIIYISPSPLKAILKSATAFALSISPQLLYIYHP
jgi:polysaccharide export outer membrane protein